MIDLAKLKWEVLCSGRVDEHEVVRICEELYADGRSDSEVAEFLAGIRREAQCVCKSFEQLFGEIVRHNVVVDDAIFAHRVSCLRSLLVADGAASETEKKLLWDLKRQTKNVCPE